ncbi:hypothetical protein LguiB_023418 [Lonicera macranthoides]
MARSLSQILIRNSTLATRYPPTTNTFPLASRLLTQRNQSSNSDTIFLLDDPNTIESEHENSSSSSSSSRETLAAVQRIEDAIHRIVVIRSAPDWLPFRPGSSYWVPPRIRSSSSSSSSSYGIADLMHRLSNSLTQEELMSLTTSRGWPSSSFYFNPDVFQDSVDVETTSKNMPESNEEEG